MRSKRGRSLFALFSAALFFWGSVASCAESGKRAATRDLSIMRRDGSAVSLRVEIADNDEERSRGLMHRKEVPDGEGMLFVFDSDRRLSFWMKNTLVPLTIAFIAQDGRILEVYDMTPLSLAPVESARSVRYALEVPRGWFARSGVAVGDRLLLSEN